MKTLAFVLPLFVVACSGSPSSEVPSPGGTSTSTTPTEPSGGTPTPTEPTKTDEGRSDAPPGPAPSGPSTKPDCKAYASAYCTKANACGHLVATILGGACETRMAAVCETHVAAPGTGYSPTALAACSNAFASSGCDLEPAACAMKGALPLEAACAFDDQCVTGACSATSTTCGKCVVATKTTASPKAGLGETCDDSAKTAPACNGMLGLTCDSKTKACVEIPTAALGEPCGWFGMIVMCASGGTCKPGTTGSGTCVAEKGIGDLCSGSSGYDECTFGTACIAGGCAFPTAAAICK
jgi:hypothetical protein